MSHETTKSLIIGLLILGLLASLSAVVFALASGPATADASVYVSDPTVTTNEDRLRIEAGTPNCSASPARYSYVKWNLTDATGKAIGSGKLTFTVQTVSLGNAVAGNQQLELYATTDGWSDTTVNWNNKPAFGTLLQSVVVPTTAGSVITFDTSASAALLQYLQNEAGSTGDKVASFGLALAGNCGDSAVVVRLYSQGPNPTGVVPTLDLRSGGPNAVELTTLQAEQPAPNWPLYIGLGALAVLAAVGLLLYRRRASAAR